MESLDVLLSDQFAEFSQTVNQISVKKKKLTQEFKTLYTKYEEEMKSLDKTALQAQTNFEDWKTEREKSVGDG